MKDYASFYEKQTAFLKKCKNPAKLLSILDHVVTGVIGVLYLTGLILAACGLFGSYLPTLFSVLLPPVCALIAVTILRLIIPRKRPYEEGGAHITPICKKAGESHSFPSRHAACAFVIGVTLCSLSLWLGIPALLLGVTLAYIRFLCGFHYPTDLIGGAILGSCLGVIAFFL